MARDSWRQLGSLGGAWPGLRAVRGAPMRVEWGDLVGYWGSVQVGFSTVKHC